MELLLGRNGFNMKPTWLKLIPVLLVFSFGALALHLVCFKSIPIVSCPKRTEIIEILYVCSPSDNTVSIKDYNNSAIINYLHYSYGRRTLFASNTFQEADYILIITLRDGNKIKQLHLGINNSYISEGVGKPNVKLCDEEKVLNDLLVILNIQSKKEGAELCEAPS